MLDFPVEHISYAFEHRNISELDYELLSEDLSKIDLTPLYPSKLTRGNIYCISGPNGVNYVGSTFNDLFDRWSQHVCSYNQWTKSRSHGVSIYAYFEKYGIANFSIRLLHSYDVVDHKHLFAYETLWINSMSTINKNKPFGLSRVCRNRPTRRHHKRV